MAASSSRICSAPAGRRNPVRSPCTARFGAPTHKSDLHPSPVRALTPVRSRATLPLVVRPTQRWLVEIAPEFVPELRVLAPAVQDAIAAGAGLLRRFGPHLGRPRVDTLYGSRYPNMKELRFRAVGQPWRVALAFDPRRKATLFYAAAKSERSRRRIYPGLIREADARFDAHLARINQAGGT